jgi:hypothetical protein
MDLGLVDIAPIKVSLVTSLQHDGLLYKRGRKRGVPP